MRLIVLAAGKGSRMGALGKDNPKCVLKIQKTTIIERLINQFKKYGVNNISIVVGYKSEKIKKIIGNNYNYIFYENYKNTNNLHTLWHARNEIEEETIITFETYFLKRILNLSLTFLFVLSLISKFKFMFSR